MQLFDNLVPWEIPSAVVLGRSLRTVKREAECRCLHCCNARISPRVWRLTEDVALRLLMMTGISPSWFAVLIDDVTFGAARRRERRRYTFIRLFFRLLTLMPPHCFANCLNSSYVNELKSAMNEWNQNTHRLCDWMSAGLSSQSHTYIYCIYSASRRTPDSLTELTFSMQLVGRCISWNLETSWSLTNSLVFLKVYSHVRITFTFTATLRSCWKECCSSWAVAATAVAVAVRHRWSWYNLG